MVEFLTEAEQSLPIETRTSEIRVQLASGIFTAARDGERDPYDCDLLGCAE
jgi:hypothetical protein